MRSVWLAFRYSSPLPVRVMLALALVIRAVLLAVSPSNSALLAIAPAQTWALSFGTLGALMLWRVAETRPRIGITRILNAAACGMWLVYIAANYKTHGTLQPELSADLVAFLASAWVAIRTDLTHGDRGAA